MQQAFIDQDALQAEPNLRPERREDRPLDLGKLGGRRLLVAGVAVGLPLASSLDNADFALTSRSAMSIAIAARLLNCCRTTIGPVRFGVADVNIRQCRYPAAQMTSAPTGGGASEVLACGIWRISHIANKTFRLGHSSTQRRSAQRPNLARSLANKQTKLARRLKKSLQHIRHNSVIRFIAQFLFVRFNGGTLPAYLSY